MQEVRALLASEWGLSGEVMSLGSHEDENFLVAVREVPGTSRTARYVLKVTAPTTDAEVVAAQSAGLDRLAAAGLPFATPRVVPTLSGAGVVPVPGDDGGHLARVLTWVDGTPLASSGHLAPVVRRGLGGVAGATAAALAGLTHPALDRPFTWDLRAFSPVVSDHVGSVADAGRRSLASAAASSAADALDPLTGSLRLDTIHADVTDLNVVARAGADGRPVPCGLIDVGDLSTGWVVAEAAVAACSAVAHDLATPLAAVTDVVAGFDAVLPLTDDEVAALWWLVVARSAVLCVTTEHQVVVDPDNAYVAEALEREWASLAALLTVPAEVAHQALRFALGRESTPVTVPAVTVPVVDPPPPFWRARASDPAPERARTGTDQFWRAEASDPAPGRARTEEARGGGDAAGVVVDLSTTSDRLGPGAWESAEAMGALLGALPPGTVARHGEGRLVAPDPTPAEPATVSLGATVVLPVGTEVVAPFPATVTRADPDAGLVVLSPVLGADPVAPTTTSAPRTGARATDLVLRGVAPAVTTGEEVAVGRAVAHVSPVLGAPDVAQQRSVHQEPDGTGTAPALGAPEVAQRHAVHQERMGTPTADPWPWPAHLHVTWAPAGVVPPRSVRGTEAGAWLACCPGPSDLLGLPPGTATAERPDPAALLARRDAVLARAQEHYWDAPPIVERGWGTRLFDTDGRPYLDAVNNVAVLGHSHPAVTEAVTRQLRRLNTNSRFHYEAAVAYAERLAGLLPDPLDTVFLVNTGSEACDLALRLIRSVTGQPDVLALQGAYHGWTMATDAVSTSLFDNPAALGSRPDWVHLVEAPNTYRGRFRGPADAGERYAADVDRAIAELAADGRAPAGFIAEPLSGNAGGIVLPPGYLAGAYARVRATGGLCVADEVQTGLGRLGDWTWAFESQDVVPDVVTVAKATGNGIACGAVVTTRAIADAFTSEGSFFSSVGGSPVSAAAGLAVLDVIEADGLQAHARTVGAHLRARLDDLVARFPLCGAVHGLGLYLGLELVRDADLTPATEEAAAICERARELGVVVQPTGDGANVLKVKPPLVFTVADADLLAGTLEHILATGW